MLNNIQNIKVGDVAIFTPYHNSNNQIFMIASINGDNVTLFCLYHNDPSTITRIFPYSKGFLKLPEHWTFIT